MKDEKLLLAFGLGWILSKGFKKDETFVQGQLVNPYAKGPAVSKIPVSRIKAAKIKPNIVPMIKPSQIPMIPAGTKLPSKITMLRGYGY